MCGIIGYVGKNNAIETIISGLERLEYRGYDSAGIAYLNKNKLNIVKEKGKIEKLKNKLDFKIRSDLGIGHTRWATHGEANFINSHPHNVGSITIVHNGIIENYMDLKKELETKYIFKSNTDTEIACALLDYYYQKTGNMIEAIKTFKEKVKGAYALGIICSDDPKNIYAIKNQSPLIIALGEKENYIASDVPAIVKYTDKYILLDDQEFAKINQTDITLYNKDNKEIHKEIKIFKGDKSSLDKNGYDHYMLKEINEEPFIIKNLIDKYTKNNISSLKKLCPSLKKFKRIDIVACGSAYHAGLIGKSLIEKYGNIPVNVEIASEYRYKKLFLDKNVLVIIVSQSGETADSLAALKIAKEHNAYTLGIVNVKESSIAREVDRIIYTEAGSEVAVATTKAYAAQIAVFSLIALKIAYELNTINNDEIICIIKDLKKDYLYIENMINKNDLYLNIANKIADHNDIFFIGRGIDYALSLEGSLKLKEISYINSQGYPSGELKHGTISLIELNTPVIALISDPLLADKTISNIKEVKARGAYVILIVTDKIPITTDFYDELIIVPTTSNIIQSNIMVIPLQLIAYEVAKIRQCNIDKPRNLAKSVTVE